VGHDIAITGFDDGDLAKTLEPPLSSVAHSSFLFSYRAVHAALELAKGKKPPSEEMKAYFHKRESCGCKFALNETRKIDNLVDLREHMATRVEIITDELFSTVPYEKDKSQYREWLGAFLNEVIAIVFEGKDEDLDNEVMHRNLKKMCQHPFVSKQIMLEYLEKVLFEFMDYTDEEQKKLGLTALLRSVRQYVHSQEVNVLQQENVDVQRKMWFLPSFTVDLINASSYNTFPSTFTTILASYPLYSIPKSLTLPDLTAASAASIAEAIPMASIRPIHFFSILYDLVIICTYLLISALFYHRISSSSTHFIK